MPEPSMFDRLLSALRKLIRLEVAPLRWLGTYEYVVVRANGQTSIDCAPTSTQLGLPQLNSVVLRSDSLATLQPTEGKLCHIVFVNGLLQNPKCVWCEPAAQNADIVGGGPAVARVGDAVGPGAFVVILPGPVTSGTPTPYNVTGSGAITGGSSKVTCG